MVQGLMTLILGRKKGMTQVFTDDGAHIGVTVVEAGPCVVTQVRTQEKDGCWWDTPAGNYGDKWGTGFALLTLGRFEEETARRQKAADEKQAHAAPLPQTVSAK